MDPRNKPTLQVAADSTTSKGCVGSKGGADACGTASCIVSHSSTSGLAPEGHSFLAISSGIGDSYLPTHDTSAAWAEIPIQHSMMKIEAYCFSERRVAKPRSPYFPAIRFAERAITSAIAVGYSFFCSVIFLPLLPGAEHFGDCEPVELPRIIFSHFGRIRQREFDRSPTLRAPNCRRQSIPNDTNGSASCSKRAGRRLI